MIWTYLHGKSKQLKHACWFCAGLFFGLGTSVLGFIALGLAIVFDFLSVCLSRKEAEDDI